MRSGVRAGAGIGDSARVQGHWRPADAVVRSQMIAKLLKMLVQTFESMKRQISDLETRGDTARADEASKALRNLVGFMTAILGPSSH